MTEDTAASPHVDEQLASTDDPSSFARVSGKPVVDLPNDLYIPPDALAVFLEAFEGPLDLLLYLIRRQNMDILDIDVSEITRQ
jgi:segregation and condensation protein A